MPPNPSELLVSERWYQLLQDSQKEYDAIFVDFPSLGIVSDALCLAQVATTYVLVIRENLTRIERIEMIVRRLESLVLISVVSYTMESPRSHRTIIINYMEKNIRRIREYAKGKYHSTGL